MSQSHTHSRSVESRPSPEKARSAFSVKSTPSVLNIAPGLQPGTMDDGTLVRTIVAEALKNCGRSRAQIAEQMSYLTGTTVTERSLNNFSANSREDCRFPAELERAFCAATSDYRLLTCRAQMAGLHIVDPEALALIELGREYLRQKRASAAIAALEIRLEGVVL